MQKALIALLLFGTSAAHAGWVGYAETNSAESFYDPVNIRKTVALFEKSNQFWQIWSLDLLKQAAADGHQSERTQYEFDCFAGQARILQRLSFASADGSGRAVQKTQQASPWLTISPNTALQQLQNVACRGSNRSASH